MWPDLIHKAKEGGLDVIQTYVFWNGHEPAPGEVMKSKILLKKKKIFLVYRACIFGKWQKKLLFFFLFLVIVVLLRKQL